MTGFAGLIKQRRRWLNGTFFAMIYTLSNWNRIWLESHHRCAPRAGMRGVCGALAAARVCVTVRVQGAGPWGFCSRPLPALASSRQVCCHACRPCVLHPLPPSTPRSFLRKCVLSLEFVYLMIMTFAGTWFGIGVFYTILYQLFMALFNGSTTMENVSPTVGRGSVPACCVFPQQGAERGCLPGWQRRGPWWDGERGQHSRLETDAALPPLIWLVLPPSNRSAPSYP